VLSAAQFAFKRSTYSPATAPKVFRAAVVAAILSSFFFVAGSVPSTSSVRASSRFARACARVTAGKR
jgi:hypothetical protein